MSNFPNSLDTDIELPRVDDNLTEIGGEAINALRDATFNIQTEIGIGASGTAGSIANRLSVALDPAGNIKPSALSLLPLLNNIVDAQVSSTAGIKESKLQLDHSTASLYNYINNFNTSLNTALNFIINSGSKFEPHLQGITYRHDLSHIDISTTTSGFFKNKKGLFRNNTNLYTLTNDINNDFIAHQKANGTTAGEEPPDNYGHIAAGIKLKSENFASIPQTTTDVQKFADYLDGAGILTIGTRIHTLYQNGIPKTSRSSSLTPVITTTNALSTVQQGQPIVPITTVVTYLSNSGNIPLDDIDTGDDIVEFTPSVAELTGNLFDSKFSAVKIGDIISINYGSVVVPFIIKEVKYVVSGSNRRFLVRINSKNLSDGISNTARIDRSLFNINKYGALSLASAFSPINSILPSLIVGSPRGAQVLGIGFNPNFLNQSHYNLYLVLYPTGNPAESVVNMTAVDVTGNNGTTPGSYTLESVVEALNYSFRRPGFNFRFIAFTYQGNLGIMLADSINNSSFSIISGILGPLGVYDQGLSNTSYPLNVIDVFNSIDPLGFGPNGVNIASPPYSPTFSPTIAALNPTKLLVPLSKNTYYVNGSEKEKLNTEPNQLLDLNKEGYWLATITNKLIVAGARVQTTYTVTGFDLSNSGLKAGKTIVIQSNSGGTAVDFGRFIIQNVEFKTCVGNIPATDITVYDAIHSTGSSPYVSSGVGTSVKIYLSSDSVGFNIENSTDISSITNFKRHFEVYIDSNASTFTHERARLLNGGTNAIINSVPLYASSELSSINLYKVSSKLRGYIFSSVRKINLRVNSYDVTTGVFDGYLCKYDGYTVSNIGPTTIGKKGEVVRFFDETTIDYIDFIFDINDTVTQILITKNIDIQLFPSLSLDDDVMLLGTCQVNDSSKEILYLRDERQFGNTSEKQFSNSAIDFVNSGNRLLNQNGIIKGFDIISVSSSTNSIVIRGGTALVNGSFIEANNMSLNVSLVQETYLSTDYSKINWALCINSKGEFKFIALTDFDSTSPATPNSPKRVITAKNPVNALTYPIESRSFVEIVENRKDLTLLYKITSIVDGTGILTSLSSYDARKYVFENNSIIDPVLTSEKSQGNFYNFDALATWLNYNTNYDNNVGIKGSSSITGTYIFNTSYVTRFNGNDVSTLTFASGSNVTFNNFQFNELPIVINSGATVVFNNCVFDTCTLVLNQSVTLSSSTKFINSSITVNSANGIVINSSDISFDKCNFIYMYDPNISGDIGYVIGNKINVGFGMITVQNSNSFQIRNLSVTNSKFTTLSSNYYPFICFEFNHVDSHYQDIIIRNNKFYNTTSSVVDSTRGAIIFANNVIVSGNLEGPRLVNLFIEENLFDKNQIIAIVSKTDGSSLINNALSTVNCHISGNICGAIGFLTRYETIRNYPNSSNLVRDKESVLFIERNNCKTIKCMSYTGGSVSSWSNVEIETGKVIISKNSLGSIDIGLKSNTSITEGKRSLLLITDNAFGALISTDPFYLGYAIFINGPSPAAERLGQIIISNNITDFGTTVANDGTTKTIGYYTSYINSAISENIISNNIFKGVGSSNSHLIQIDGYSEITGNSLHRGSFNLSGGYILIAGGDHIITDNFFDSPTVNGTSEELLVYAGGTAVYERNKNQTSYASIDISRAKVGSSFSGNSASIVMNYYTGTAGASALSVLTISTIASASSVTQNYILSLSDFIPDNITIISCILGLVLEDTNLGNTTFSMSIGKYMDAVYDSTSSATLLNSLADIKNITNRGTTTESAMTFSATSNVLTVGSGGISNATFIGSTQYIKIENINFNIRHNKLNASLNISSSHTSGSLASSLVSTSPLLIKYRW